MEVIALLIKIVNREELPKTIKYQHKTFKLDDNNVYVRVDKVKGNDYGYKDLFDYISVQDDLTDKVEIIEEDKEIEELKLDTQLIVEWNLKRIEEKINELIKTVNELKKGK